MRLCLCENAGLGTWPSKRNTDQTVFSLAYENDVIAQTEFDWALKRTEEAVNTNTEFPMRVY